MLLLFNHAALPTVIQLPVCLVSILCVSLFFLLACAQGKLLVEADIGVAHSTFNAPDESSDNNLCGGRHTLGNGWGLIMSEDQASISRVNIDDFIQLPESKARWQSPCCVANVQPEKCHKPCHELLCTLVLHDGLEAFWLVKPWTPPLVGRSA